MSDPNDPNKSPIYGPVVGQYFGIFHGCSKEHYRKIVETAPFDCCNLLILGFVGITGNNLDPPQYSPRLRNSRDNDFNGGRATADDTDEDRIRAIVKAARAKNANIRILISLGWYNEVVKAAKTPEFFAESLAFLVKTYELDGFDIDYEDTPDVPQDPAPFGPDQFIGLMHCVRKELGKVVRRPILTITPAILRHGQDSYKGLSEVLLNCFTYTMPQSYDHGGNGTRVDDYAQKLKSYDKIVYGLCGEGIVDDPDNRPDDPERFVRASQANGAAGVFSWRLDTDSIPTAGSPEGDAQLPTFAVARKMEELMRWRPT